MGLSEAWGAGGMYIEIEIGGTDSKHQYQCSHDYRQHHPAEIPPLVIFRRYVAGLASRWKTVHGLEFNNRGFYAAYSTRKADLQIRLCSLVI